MKPLFQNWFFRQWLLEIPFASTENWGLGRTVYFSWYLSGINNKKLGDQFLVVLKFSSALQTKHGSRPSCCDQEGWRGSQEVVPWTLVFPSSETGMSGNFGGRIKGAKYRFVLQDGTWDFPWYTVAAKGLILRWRGSHVVFLELQRDSRVTTGTMTISFWNKCKSRKDYTLRKQKKVILDKRTKCKIWMIKKERHCIHKKELLQMY